MNISESIDTAIETITMVLSSHHSINSILNYGDVKKKCEYARRNLERAKQCIPTRNQSERILESLVENADSSTNEVEWNGQHLPYYIARTLSFQSYTGITWILYDLISEALSYFRCSYGHYINPSNHFRLVKSILSSKEKEVIVSAIDADLAKVAYGWPIGVSYCIRNVFAHEADALYDGKVFEGNDVNSEYVITQEMHRHILSKCTLEKNYNVKQEYTRRGESWPWGVSNLFEMLKICNNEIDEYMCGILTSTFIGFKQLVLTLSYSNNIMEDKETTVKQIIAHWEADTESIIIEEIEFEPRQNVFSVPKIIKDEFGVSRSCIPLPYIYNKIAFTASTVEVGVIYTPSRIGANTSQLDDIVAWIQEHIYPHPVKPKIIGIIFTNANSA